MLPTGASSGNWANISVLTPGMNGGVPWEAMPTHRRVAVTPIESGAATAPVNLTGAVSGSTVTLAWTPAGAEIALGYIVEAGSRAGLSDLANFDTGSAAVSLTATDVPAGTYYVRVRLRTASGISPPSNEIAIGVTASACTRAPAAPTGLTSAASGSTVTLQWTAPSQGCAPTGYTIEAGSSPGAGNLANVATGSTATTFSGSAVGNGTYYLRVRATNAFGAGAASNESTLTVGTAAPGGFTVDLPIAAGDPQSNAYGIWPFGVHGGTHAADGHPGWDVEFRPGASVLVAADGTVSSVFPEGDRYSIRIQHSVSGANYATDYTNIGALGPGIAAGARVTRGQVLGTAGVQSQFIGSTMVTWAMTHFQVNDFSRNEGLTNPNAVSPEPYLSASGRAIFDAMWRTAGYNTEWCEPFFTNSRLATFPVTRTWRLQSGSSQIASIEIRCLSATTNDMAYSLYAAGGSLIESGTFVVEATKKPLAIADFRPSSGSSRLGVWDIFNETRQLNAAAPGAPRPSSLAGAATYTTTR